VPEFDPNTPSFALIAEMAVENRKFPGATAR